MEVDQIISAIQEYAADPLSADETKVTGLIRIERACDDAIRGVSSGTAVADDPFDFEALK